MEVDSRVIRLLDCDIRMIEKQSVVRTDCGVIVLNESATTIVEYIKKQNDAGIDVSIKDIASYIGSVFDIEGTAAEEIIADVKMTIERLGKEGVVAIEHV